MESKKSKKAYDKDYNSREVKKVMRLCSIGMITDGVLCENERLSIVEIVLHDFLADKFSSIENLTSDFDYKKLTITTLPNNTAEIRYNGDWSMKVDQSEQNELYTTLCKRIKRKYKVADNTQLCKMALQQYALARYFIEDTVIRLNKEEVCNGLFVNIDSLDTEDVITELRDMILVIKADKIITEIERMVFISVAKIMRVADSNIIWDDWFDYSQQKLNRETISHLIPLYSRRKSITKYDVKIIEDTITSGKVKGPMFLGLQNAIIRGKEGLQKRSDRKYNLISILACFVFVISACLLYFESAINIEQKVIMHEMNIGIEDCIVSSNINGYLSNSDTNYETFGEKTELTFKEKRAIVKDNMNSLSDNGENKLIFIILASSFGYILYLFYRVTNYLITFYTRRITWLQKIIKTILSILFIVFALWLIYRFTPTAILSLCYIPFLTLCMMTSIEVMVFIRSRYMSKVGDDEKDSTGLIMLFAIAAIVIDFCLGYIDLPVGYESWMLWDKLASAILLGCISFFVGKFLDTDSIEQQVEMKEINNSIEKIKKYCSPSEDSHA